ncbi:TRAP transporter substrate-binding protein [Tropicimonas sp. IMCC6043]|uniref:TRAP transporter substrate-binding protein n=1 Tax=Tropicimonas sp. IMCC6043 TaxID=2510645 RepID=UPI00101D1D80|nr:TRAP transporter substrate-binding protein [Tropicimonas sp. IMCC6043]RYH12292.1 TRAP transporter substrate-binding protein [Tropicimonas sp. IMCC6043]
MNKLATTMAGVGLAITATVGAAFAEPIVIKVGYSSEGEIRLPGASRSAGMAAFKDHVENGSDGAIQVELHPDGALGNARTMIESAQTGAIQMVGGYTSIMVPFMPEIAITQIPYVFPNDLTAWKVMEGPVGDDLADLFLERTGLRVLGWGDGAGFRQIYSETPIKSVADLKGMKMRVPENPGLLAMFRAWGANTVTITWAELYTSLQTGMAEGHDTELYSMYSKKLYEVNPYVTMTRHSYNMHPIMINEEFFQSLSPEHQMLVLQAGDLYERVANAHSLVSSLVVEAAMEAEGAVFYYPTAAEIAEFKELGQPAYIDIIEKKIPDGKGQEWVDRIMAATAEVEEQS